MADHLIHQTQSMLLFLDDVPQGHLHVLITCQFFSLLSAVPPLKYSTLSLYHQEIYRQDSYSHNQWMSLLPNQLQHHQVALSCLQGMRAYHQVEMH